MIWAYLNGRLKNIQKTDHGQFLSRKKFSPKNYWSFVDFKNEVFGKPDSGQKNRNRASGRHHWHGGSWKWINWRVPEWWVEENCNFIAKPETGQNVSGEKICIRNFLFKCRFQKYLYVFNNRQSQSKDMNQMVPVSHNNN